MKRTRMLLFAVGVLIVYMEPVDAAEYIAKQGDTWAQVAGTTGQSLQQLAEMNNVTDPKDSDTIPAGQKIIYLNKDDLDCAYKWCEKREKELSYGEPGYNQVWSALRNLKEEQICYSSDKYANCSSRPRFADILDYAKSWREAHK